MITLDVNGQQLTTDAAELVRFAVEWVTQEQG